MDIKFRIDVNEWEVYHRWSESLTIIRVTFCRLKSARLWKRQRGLSRNCASVTNRRGATPDSGTCEGFNYNESVYNIYISYYMKPWQVDPAYSFSIIIYWSTFTQPYTFIANKISASKSSIQHKLHKNKIFGKELSQSIQNST